MKPIRSSATTVLFALLAACVPQPKPTPPAPAQAALPSVTLPNVPQPKYENWLDAPQTAGDWSYRQSAQETSAVFGVAGSRPRFAMTCDLASKRITLAQLGMVAAKGDLMTIRTETATRSLPTETPDRAVTATYSYLAGSDRLLDAMALSKGRFAIEIGPAILYLPSWAEVTRVIEDCR